MPSEQAELILHQPLINALQRVSTAVTRTGNLEDVLCGVLEGCSEGLACAYPSVALLDAQGERLVGKVISSPATRYKLSSATQRSGVRLDSLLGLRVDRRLAARPVAGSSSIPQDAIGYRLDMTDNLVVRAFLERSPFITSRFHDVLRPHLQAKVAAVVQRALDIKALALVPLIAAERCLGVLIVASSPSQAITSSTLPILSLFGAWAAIAVENVRLHQDLRNREQQVSLLLKKTIDAQEEERERICLEIHDGVAQTLAGAFHYLQTLDNRPELPDDLRGSLHKASTLVRNAGREARDVIANLRPTTLDTLGLVAALQYQMNELQARTGWRVDFDADQVRFPKAVETALYRIVQEAVNNVTKHAHAKRVKVRIKQEHGRAVVEVEDDGVGFNPYALQRDPHRMGVGMLSMRKRAELLQGSFQIFSDRGSGTRVHVEVPLFADENHVGP
ncbi:MAG: GAF domain-containing sensor histidine kinase [Chloroflexi bacterium]|nr:GAF domain-containing sensor histidine kinase [Chloroflexota bacterium]